MDNEKQTKWVLVETVSTFRMRYMVELHESEPTEYALDDVTCEECVEFSQEHIGELIVSHREISLDDALKLCDIDNAHHADWDSESKINAFFTPIHEE